MAYGKFAMVYDRLMDDMPYGEWVSFTMEGLLRHGQRPETAVVADLGCGTGNIAIPLSGMGCKVFGIDLSEDMLSAAEAKSRAFLGAPAGGRSGEAGPVWLRQDMTEWELDQPVDVAISYCDCLNYLTEAEDVAAFFRQSYAGLAPGGLFIFDVHTPRTIREYADNQPFIFNDPDLSYIWVCELDEELCLIEHELTFFLREPGQAVYERFDEVHRQRAYPLEGLKELLEETGFEQVEIFGDFSWRQADEETERAFFVAVKPL